MFRRLLLGAVLTAGLTASARSAEIDNLLPAETESVMYLNVRQIIDSDLVKKYALGQIKQMLAGNEEAQRMLKDLGLDPLKDIERVTVGIWGKGPEDMQTIAVIRGAFDKDKLIEAAKKEAKNNGDKIAVVKEGEHELVKYTDEKQPKPFFAGVADGKTIIAGNDKKLVAKTLDAAKEKVKPAIKKELALLLLGMDEKSSMYFCGMTDGKIDQLPPGVNIPGVDSAKLVKQLENMRNFAMTFRVTDEVGLDVSMGMKDDDTAEDFGDTISQLIGTVKGFLPLVTGQQPNFKPLADEVSKTLKSKVKAKNVSIVLKLSAEAIGKATGGGD